MTDLPINASMPDENDIFFASHVVLKPCPFCGFYTGTPLTWQNETTKIWRAVVECGKCEASTASNSYDKNEARADAMTKWERRAK